MQSKKRFRIMGIMILAYFIILLSNVAKQIEEKDNIPHMDTTTELLDEYTENKYASDWSLIGRGMLWQDRRAFVGTLDLKAGKDIVIGYGTDNWYSVLYSYEVNEVSFGVMFSYGMEDDIRVVKNIDGEYISYIIEYEDKYIPNPEMEKAFGISTKEVMGSVDETCDIIETEVQNMHTYQINKARKIRGILATIGAIGFVLYTWLKGFDTGESEGNRDLYKKYFFLKGLIACFWTYMLRPIISQFVLFWLNGEANRYVAYAISALAVGIILGVVSQKAELDLHEEVETKRQMFFRTVLGITMCTVLIRIGVAIASNFYFYEWKTYLLNFIAAGCAIRIYERFHNLKTKKIDNQMLS